MGVFANSNELWFAIREQWEDIRQNEIQLCEPLVDSMPRRMEALIRAEGGITKY
jgi:hypothetical protein